MRAASPELVAVLQSGSFSTRLIADAFVGGERVIKDLGHDAWELRWDREADLKSGGALRVVHESDDGTSVSPKEVTDSLAPFGGELNLLLEVSAGQFSETVQLGHFRIAEVPAASDQYADFGTGQIVTSSVVDLVLEDRLSRVKRRGFRSEENPASLSAWDELARISGMQVMRSLPDVTLPGSFIYKAVRGGRLAAVRAIAGLLGGTEYTTPDGALSVCPYEPGAVVGSLVLGEDGTILGDDSGMDATEVFNVVVGDFETVDRQPIHVVAIAGGLLAPSGQYDENTLYHSNDAITTLEAAEVEVEAVLAQVSTVGSYRITVQCVINPLIEDGDVVTLERRDGSTITGRVVNHRLGGSRSMTLSLDVIPDAI